MSSEYKIIFVLCIILSRYCLVYLTNFVLDYRIFVFTLEFLPLLLKFNSITCAIAIENSNKRNSLYIKSKAIKFWYYLNLNI